jgi:ADP-heptose:LPS heptosyltransferase
VHVEHGDPVEAGPGVVARPWPATGHEIERCLGLVAAVGVEPLAPRLEFPIDDLDRAECRRHRTEGRPMAVVHPGASRPDRRWSSEGFAAVARKLAAVGYDVVVVAGPPPERPLADAVSRGARGRVRVIDDLSLGAYAALLSSAALLVVNDTGIAHLGVAVDVPTVVVGTTSDLDRWGPLDRERHRVVQTVGDLGDDVDAVLAALRSIRPRRPGDDPATR